MIRYAFIIMIMFSLLTGSCSSRKNKLDNKDLIPEKDLVSILTDIHLADGLLELPSINSWASSFDSISSYYQVIEKHGYSKKALDETMHYYFLKEPKKLNKIYDQVLGELSKMEAGVDKEFSRENARNLNLWTGKEFYESPSPDGSDSTKFEITLFKKGIYTLSFTVTLFPDDQSVNPEAFGIMYSPDSVGTGKNRYVKTIHYIKDGRPHNYYLTFFAIKNPINQLSGWLYDADIRSYGLLKHYTIDNISLKFNNAGI
jgi:hypothetical protein